MLALGWDSSRLFLHVLAATIWVGGQLVLAVLVPVLRQAGPEVPRAAARAFNRVAWPAFAVLVATGIWNITAERALDQGADYRHTLWLKLGVVAASGITAFAHVRASTSRGRALFGALTALSALAALLLGILLAG